LAEILKSNAVILFVINKLDKIESNFENIEANPKYKKCLETIKNVVNKSRFKQFPLYLVAVSAKEN